MYKVQKSKHSSSTKILQNKCQTNMTVLSKKVVILYLGRIAN